MEGVSRFQKETSVVVVELDSGDYVIIVSLATRNDTQIISVDPTTGALCFSGRKNIDVFTSEADAGRYINSRHLLVKNAIRGKALLGYAALGGVGLLLIATKTKATVPELPGGDCVYTVIESQWVKIPLRNPIQSKVETKNALELADITIDGLYFFCESRDITRHFPSNEAVEKPDKEFVWNLWLSAPFKALGLPRHCAVLLQGFAEFRSFHDSRDNLVTVAVIARRSRLHAGTRYLARGLNATCSTGNEVECEQLVWPPKTPPNVPVPFSTYLWRRGTVPIWWGAEIKSTVSEAEIYVAEKDPFLGSGTYFNRLVSRYKKSTVSNDAKASDENTTPLIVCINLLRNGIGRPELVLAQRFQDAISYLKTRNEVPDAKLVLINYDWHEKTKLIGDPMTVTGLWERLRDPTVAIGFAMGEYYPDGQVSERGMVPSKGSQGGFFKMSSQQDGVIRFNCADSLDRTNAASFFGAVQVLVEQCRRLGVPLDSDNFVVPTTAASSQRGDREKDSSRGNLGPLPPGWEMRSDAVTGQVFYIDHNTRTTTWNHPCPDEPWRRFDMTVEEFRDATLASPIAAAADLFLLAGDIHAMLYTGSKAMHSHIIQIFSEEVNKGKRSTAQNVAITLQRRFLNVVMDNSRQKQLEMFLGYRMFKYFPTLPGRPLQVLTRPDAFLLNTVPTMFPLNNLSSHNFLLSNKFKETVWVCPTSTESVELLLYLAEPCHVCQLLLTIAHGADEITSPGSFEIRTGHDLGELKSVLERTSIPRCANGTSLVYPLLGPINHREVAITGAGAAGGPEEKAFPWLYEFEEQEGGIDFLTRLVAITFYPAAPGLSMTLGQVEILGASLVWTALGRTSGMCRHRKTFGTKRDSFAAYVQQKKPLSPSVDLLSLEDATGDGSSVHSIQPSNSTQVFDLLTGEFIDTPSASSPSVSSSASTPDNNSSLNGKTFSKSKSRNLIASDSSDWNNPFLTEGTQTSSNSPARGKPTTLPETRESVSQEHPGVEVYLDLINTLYGTTPPMSPTFTEAAELEIARLHLGLSAAQRDRALLSVGRDPATLDPNRLIDRVNLVQMRQAALQLAAVCEVDAEDKDLSRVGFDAANDEPTTGGDEDDYHCLRTGCLSSDCQVTYVKDPRGMFQFFRASAKNKMMKNCILCRRVVCAACQAGKGSALLYQNGPNLGNVGASSTTPKPARGPSTVDAIICKSCCPPVVRDIILLERVRAKSSDRRQARVHDACEVAMQGLVGVQLGAAPVNLSLSPEKQDKRNAGGNRTTGSDDGDSSLADFPYAGIISSVPTRKGSEPLHSLLVTKSESSTASWSAPVGVETVELCIVLSTLSLVSSVILFPGSGGYSLDDGPLVDLWYSNVVTDSDRNYVGRLDIKSEVATGRSSGGSGPSFCYKLRGSVSCRIIWIKLTLPSARTGPVEAEPVMDLLSFNDHPPPARAKTSGGRTASIHVQRIMVLGQQLPEDTDPRFLTQSVDKVAHKTLLDIPPKFYRLRVQVDVERPLVGGRIVELVVNQQAPNVAGFRLDTFAAVKNVAKYTSADSDGGLVSRVLGGSMEELIANLPILRIRVSAIQESQQLIPVGEYIVPNGKPGTPLYFDFGVPILVRLITFELVGNISAMSDEEPNLDEGKEVPLPSSLSLMNKIRIYRYTLGSELSKWPQLSAV